MSINVKKYTKDQMAKMVEETQTEVQELRRVNAALTEQISQMNGEAITRENVIANLKAEADVLRNKLADTEAALGRANAELTRSVAEKNTLRNYITKMVDRAAFECRRADYAESHPWRNLWAWVKRKMGCKA
nr:MAG TPA: PRKC APOPTOSIS WT1 REGULATOR PROTEIN [Caudoviricetes sp.]